MARELTLLFHFIGFGLIVAIQVAGFVLDSHYRKATDLQTKATLLRALKPIGLLSPIAIIIQLVTGIGNMHAIGIPFSEIGSYPWLLYKTIVFVIAATLGMIMGVKSKKRGALVGLMLKGEAPANAQELLGGYDKQIRMFSSIMPLLMLIILYLSIYGRLGGQ